MNQVQGFEAEGNEHSWYMLITSAFILNASPEAEAWTLHPWVHGTNNNLSAGHQLRGVRSGPSHYLNDNCFNQASSHSTCRRRCCCQHRNSSPVTRPPPCCNVCAVEVCLRRHDQPLNLEADRLI